MTETPGMTIPQQAWRFGSQVRSPEEVTNVTRVPVFHALNHSRRSEEASFQSPRRRSSQATAMIMPVLSSGMPRVAAYETARALPSWANRAFKECGFSWMPLWSTPLLRPLVSIPAAWFRSRTIMRSGLSHRRRPNSLAMAQPTTPAPTIQMSYVFIDAGLSAQGMVVRTGPSRNSAGWCERGGLSGSRDLEMAYG